jgi:L-alanine-DL-glutamate epimerase-like enolase superfamily enzyme
MVNDRITSVKVSLVILPLLKPASDIQRIWSKLDWLGASVGRSGVARLLGAHRDSVPCYNTSGCYLSTPIDEVIANAQASLAAGIGGIKIKVGQPDTRLDLSRVAAVRAALGGDVPLMVDANQQWNRTTATRMGLALEEHQLTWIEEPLDAFDADGHAALARLLATPIATGEMLTSPADHYELMQRGAVDIIQPDAPRIGGITPFLRVMALGEQARMNMAPHFAMEIHVHLAAAYELDPWVEHFDWLEPIFNERLDIQEGRMLIPDRPGLGFSISEQARSWTAHQESFGGPSRSGIAPIHA